MPLFNIFKNSGYYWGFAAFVAYHVNHPLYTSPGNTQIYGALAAFLVWVVDNLHTLTTFPTELSLLF